MALRDQFLTGMSNAACTVSIVTTDGVDGRQGATVSAMSSVSADTPQPTLLICINETSATAQAVKANGVFCVNVLRDNQSHISDCFAKRWTTQDGDKFSCATWVPDVLGSPKVMNGLVAFSCTVSSWQKVGSHYVFFGAVQDVSLEKIGSPLIYSNRAYGSAVPITLPSPKPPPRPVNELGIGCFHTFGPYVVPQILKTISTQNAAPIVRLIEGDQRRIVDALRTSEIDVALIYDMDLDGEFFVERLSALNPYVLLAEKHPLAAHTTLSLRDLVSWPLMLLDAPPSGDYFLSLFSSCNLDPEIGIRSTSFEMVRGLVAHGLGYGLLATKPACPMSYDGRSLTARPLTDDMTPSYISLVTRRHEPKTDAADSFEHACRALFLRTGSPF